MNCTLHVAWDDRLAGYDFGPGHPMAPVRLKLTMELARAFGLDRLDGVTVEVPAAATVAELKLVHDSGYIDMVRLAGHEAAGGGLPRELTTRVLLMHGLGTEDNPLFPGMHEAAAMVTGPRWPRPARSGRRRRSTGLAWPAACTTPWPGTPAGSASTTTRPLRSPGC
jgi:acetoin utilization protein AcuC